MKKILFVYPRFERHAASHPELLEHVPMDEYLGSPSLGIAAVAAATPPGWTVEYRDDRVLDADRPTDADIVAFSFFTPAAKRAMELADAFRARGRVVVAGGIFPTMMPDVVQPHVDAVVVGEGEELWPRILDDFEKKRLQPRYYAGPCDLSKTPVPDVDLYFGAENDSFHPDDYPLQVSRGCVLTCSACALPKTMGAAIRPFPLEQLEALAKRYAAAGKRACLTEDTGWLPGTPAARRMLELFEKMVEIEMVVSYVGISMPMIVAARPSTLEKAKAAGVDMFYLVGGFDPITTRAFTGKDPQALARAEQAIARCHEYGIEPYTSFLLGNDDDDVDTVDRMLDFAAKSGIRKAEFAIATPYPGTPRWHQLMEQDRILHTDWSKYNDANVTFKPAKMSPDQLQEGYLRLWREFYADKGHFRDACHADRTIQF